MLAQTLTFNGASSSESESEAESKPQEPEQVASPPASPTLARAQPVTQPSGEKKVVAPTAKEGKAKNITATATTATTAATSSGTVAAKETVPTTASVNGNNDKPSTFTALNTETQSVTEMDIDRITSSPALPPASAARSASNVLLLNMYDDLRSIRKRLRKDKRRLAEFRQQLADHETRLGELEEFEVAEIAE